MAKPLLAVGKRAQFLEIGTLQGTDVSLSQHSSWLSDLRHSEVEATGLL